MSNHLGVVAGAKLEGIESFSGDIQISQDIEILGNLTVQGNTTTLSDIETEDRVIIIGAGGSTNINPRGITTNHEGLYQGMLYDPVSSAWTIQKDGSTVSDISTAGKLIANDIKTSAYPSGINSAIASASTSGEINTVSHTGVGLNLFKEKVGVDFKFKGIYVDDTINTTDSQDAVGLGVSITNLIDNENVNGIWDGAKITSLIPSAHDDLKNIGTNDHGTIDQHLADDSKHRVINDLSSSNTDLWSASKIEQSIQSVNPFVETELTLGDEVLINITLNANEQISTICQGKGTSIHVVVADKPVGQKSNGGRLLTYRSEYDGSLTFLHTLSFNTVGGNFGKPFKIRRFGEYAIFEVDTRFSDGGVFGQHALKFQIVKLYPDRTELIGVIQNGPGETSYFGGVYMLGGYVYAINNTTNNLDVYEIQNGVLQQLHSVAGASFNPFLFGYPMVYGNVLFYSALSTTNVAFFDVSDPSLPTFLRNDVWSNIYAGTHNLLLGSYLIGGRWIDNVPDSVVQRTSLIGIETNLTQTVIESQISNGICFPNTGAIAISDKYVCFGGRANEGIRIYDLDNLGQTFLQKPTSLTSGTTLSGVTSNGQIYITATDGKLRSFKLNGINVPSLKSGVIDCTNFKSTNVCNLNNVNATGIKCGHIDAINMSATKTAVRDLKISGMATGITSAMVGLSNVDNKSASTILNDSALTGLTTCVALQSQSITAPLNQNVIIKNDDVSADIIVRNNGNIDLSGFNININGNLNVSGTTTTLNTQIVEIADPNLKLADGNTSDIFNMGFYSQYALPNDDIVYTGVMRCKMSKDYVFFKDSAEPDNSTNLCVLSKSGINCGNITGGGVLTIGGLLQDVERDVYGVWTAPQIITPASFNNSRNFNEYMTAPFLPVSPHINHNVGVHVDNDNISWLRIYDPGTYMIEVSGTFVPDEKKTYEIQLYQNSAETNGSNLIVSRSTIVSMKGKGSPLKMCHIAEINAVFAVWSIWVDSKGDNVEWSVYDLKLIVRRIRKNG